MIPLLAKNDLMANNFLKKIYKSTTKLKFTQKKINRQVQDLIQAKIIEPSRSHYDSPVLLVPKKGPNN